MRNHYIGTRYVGPRYHIAKRDGMWVIWHNPFRRKPVLRVHTYEDALLLVAQMYAYSREPWKIRQPVRREANAEL